MTGRHYGIGNAPTDSYVPRGEPLTKELLAVIDEREAATSQELAALRKARDEDQARYAPKLTPEQADKLRRQLAEFDERERLASVYRPVPLTADELKIINEPTTEDARSIKTQIMRAQIEGNTERLILLQLQLLSMIQRDKAVAERAAEDAARAAELARKEALQQRAREIIASEAD